MTESAQWGQISESVILGKSPCKKSSLNIAYMFWSTFFEALFFWQNVQGGGGTMGHIIALPYFKNKIHLLTGKPMFNQFV